VDTARFFAASRVVIVAGKGGVGKTMVSAALARAAALVGITTLVVELEGKSGLPALFGQEALGYDETILSPGGGPNGAADVVARALTPDDALLDYLADHGLNRVSRRLVSSGALDMVSTAAPGIRDILILGKVKQIEQRRQHGLIVLDAPAAGHAISFLRSARGLVDAVSVGPIHTQASEVLAMLNDPRRCQVVLVTLAEETPVNELIETAYQLEEDVGVHLGPVVVNGLYSAVQGLDADPAEAARQAGHTLTDDQIRALSEAAGFRRARTELQQGQVERLSSLLPLPQIHLPYLFTSEPGPADVDRLALALLAQIPGLPDIAVGVSNDSGGSP